VKLYKVKLNSYRLKPYYVVAENPDIAFNMVKKLLDEKDWGFPSERVLESIEYMAEDREYPDNEVRLLVQKD